MKPKLKVGDRLWLVEVQDGAERRGGRPVAVTAVGRKYATVSPTDSEYSSARKITLDTWREVDSKYGCYTSQAYGSAEEHRLAVLDRERREWARRMLRKGLDERDILHTDDLLQAAHALVKGLNANGTEKLDDEPT